MKKLFIPSLAALALLAALTGLSACQQRTPSVVERTTQETITENQNASVDIETQQETQEPVTEMPGGRLMRLAGDFHFDESINDYVGTLYLTGHARPVAMEEGFCTENCKKFDYVFFDVESGFDDENEALKEFMKMNEGNNFAGGKSIGIGCLEEHGIRRAYLEASIEGEATINQTDTENIMASTENNHVILKLTRKGPVPGRGAPNCYSHFSGVELVTIAPNV